MKDKDEHFWIEDVINRLPSELVPDKRDWSSVLTALTKLKTERNNAVVERNELAAQVERLRCALIESADDIDEWMQAYSHDGHSMQVVADSRRLLAETPDQSLEAVKREAAICALEDYEAALSSFEMTVPEYIKARLS